VKLVGLGLAAGLFVSAVLLLAWNGRGGEEAGSSAEGRAAIEARGVVSPSNALFGDTVTAVVEVTVDRERVDPDSVEVQADFSPWTHVESPVTVVRDAETTRYHQTTFVIRCLDRSCAPSTATVLAEFPSARVRYASPEATGSDARRTLEVSWPPLAIGSRYAATAGQGPASSGRWRADLLSVPAVSYSLHPGLLIVLLLVGAALLAGIGVVLVRLARPRRALLPRPEAQEPPAPVLTPLESALELLEDPARVDGVADRRRALELVASGLVEAGDLQLGRAARALAWSEPAPEVETTSRIAARARSALAEESREDPE
jgi:hypothetical protein